MTRRFEVVATLADDHLGVLVVSRADALAFAERLVARLSDSACNPSPPA